MLTGLKNKLPLFILFILIYFSDDTLLFGTNADVRAIICKYVICVVMTVVLFLMSEHIEMFSIVWIFFLLVAFGINLLYSQNGFGFLYNILLVVLAIFFAHYISLKRFKLYFNQIVYFLALCSIIVYFISIIFPSLLSFFPIVTNLSEWDFHNFFISEVHEGLMDRNFGIFREPGVFMCYLNLALFFELFSSDISYKHVFVYMIALVTTISTAGYFIGALIVVAYFLMSKKVNFTKILTFALFVTIFIFVSNNAVVSDKIFGKIFESTDSYIARVSSVTVPFKIFISNIFGVGPKTYDTLFPVVTSNMYAVSLDADLSTNTIMKYFAVYGIFVGGIVICALVLFVKKFSENVVVNIIFFVIILLFSSNEDLRSSILFNLLLAYGFKQKDESLINMC